MCSRNLANHSRTFFLPFGGRYLEATISVFNSTEISDPCNGGQLIRLDKPGSINIQSPNYSPENSPGADQDSLDIKFVRPSNLENADNFHFLTDLTRFYFSHFLIRRHLFNFLKEYPPNALCNWDLKVAEGLQMIVDFIDVDIETTEDCDFDSLQVSKNLTTKMTAFKNINYMSREPFRSLYMRKGNLGMFNKIY